MTVSTRVCNDFEEMENCNYSNGENGHEPSCDNGNHTTTNNNTTPTTNGNSHTSSTNRANDHLALLQLLAKLQEMVPNMPRERNLSQLEIINNVIEYIQALSDLVVDRSQHTSQKHHVTDSANYKK